MSNQSCPVFVCLDAHDIEITRNVGVIQPVGDNVISMTAAIVTVGQ